MKCLKFLYIGKKITRGLPKSRKYADDRAPTIEEIQHFFGAEKVATFLLILLSQIDDFEPYPRTVELTKLSEHSYNVNRGKRIDWINGKLVEAPDDFF